jgi:predicted DNA binding CopG/RHH family protein
MSKQKQLTQKLDKEEQDFFDSFERHDWKEIDHVEAEIKLAKTAAEIFFRKDARINIRLAKNDLTKIKQRAAHERLPYQTLIASLLHQYAKGHLA